MKNSIVRITKIQLENFKNVNRGTIDFKGKLDTDNITSELIGIYGQNGSGKTALVDACNVLKCSMSGLPLQKDLHNYINLFEKSAKLTFEFYIKKDTCEYIVEYIIEITKSDNKDFYISEEKISFSKKVNEVWNSKITMLNSISNKIEGIILPKVRFEEIISANKNNNVELRVAQKLAIDKKASFIFSEETKNILKNPKINSDYINILEDLAYFSRCNLFVIQNKNIGVINLNVIMPFSFRLEQENDTIASGDIPLGLDGRTMVAPQELNILNKIINQMNIVLKYIVPTLKIELYNYGEKIDENGNNGFLVELLSIKDKEKLPIRYESEGIKKIISILSALISMYNNPSICMVVDELDSGIYEYLLGELLKIIEKGGKGQMIFTSHNLRPLEILSRGSIYFTTTNLYNRYIKFSGVKNNNNLRSLYIRSIIIGGQKEELYQETDSLEIQRAFRLAGDKFNGI